MKKKIWMTLLLSFVLAFSSICTASAEENEGETLAQQETADTLAQQEAADTPEPQETTTPSISLEWWGASMIDGGGSTSISLQIMNNGDTDLDLSEYTLDLPKSLKLALYSDDTNNLTAIIAPNSRRQISWKASLYEDSIEAKVAMVQLGAWLKKDGKVVAERICEYPVFWIDEGRNILTYHSFEGTTAKELYKYRLRVEGDANTAFAQYFLVAGGGGNATEITGPDGSYEAYLDPAAASYPCANVKEGYTLQSVELVPSDAGTIQKMSENEKGLHIFRVQLNKPATLKITTVKNEELGQTEEGILLDKSEGGDIVSDARLVVNKNTDTSAEKNLVMKQLGISQNQVQAFDLSLLDALGNKVDFDGKMKVSIPIPEGWDASAIVVYYVDAETGKMTDMKGTVSADGKYMVFETTHFSTYLLATTKEVKAPEGSNPPAQPGTTPAQPGTTPTQPKPETLKGAVPQTGDAQPVVFWILLFAGSILCITGTGVLKTMKRR